MRSFRPIEPFAVVTRYVRSTLQPSGERKYRPFVDGTANVSYRSKNETARAVGGGGRGLGDLKG
jgi:hypothetical protein